METGYKRIIIPETLRGNLLKTCGCLPYNRDIEVGGYITPTSIYYHEGTSDNVVVPSNKTVVFHTHPVSERGDMPSELDVLNFFFMPWKSSILLTEKRLIVMSKTAASQVIEKEMDKSHEKHAIDLATRLKEDGPNSVFYYLLKNILRKHTLPFGINHRNWPEQWERFLKESMHLKLQTWECVPYSCAA